MPKAWLIMLTVYLASISVTINQFKVPPVMKLILQDLNLTLTQGGWLMSIFSVASIILAIPAVIINSKYGPKISGFFALSCVLVGSLTGSFVTSAELFMFTRVLEGVGLGLMGVIAPAVIAAWFPIEKRSLPMGIWASWVPVGFFISYNLAIPISDRYGWQGLWWLGSFVTFIALLFYIIFVSNPKNTISWTHEPKAGKFSSIIKGLKTPEPWILGLSFAGLGFANSGFLTFAPQYYSEVHGIQVNVANFYASIPFMVSIFSNPLAGYVISKFEKVKLIHLLSICLILFFFMIIYYLPSADLIVPWALILGLLLGFFATCNYTIASSSIYSSLPSPLYISLGLGINNMVYHTGFLFGPPVLASVIIGGEWTLGMFPPLISILISVISSKLYFSRISLNQKGINL